MMNDEEDDCHNYDDIGSLALIGRFNWDIDFYGVYGNPDYDTDNKSFMAEGTSLYLPFQINLEDDFIMHQGTIQILSLIVLGSQRILILRSYPSQNYER